MYIDFGLWWVVSQGFLQPDEVHIFGYARTKISDDELRNRIRGWVLLLFPSKCSVKINNPFVLALWYEMTSISFLITKNKKETISFLITKNKKETSEFKWTIS